MGLVGRDPSISVKTHRTRQSTRLIGRTSRRRFQNGTSPLGVRIPTRHRTRRRLRARNLNSDTFLSELLRVSGDAVEEASRMSLEISKSVAMATEKEREVAEALSSLRNLKYVDQGPSKSALNLTNKREVSFVKACSTRKTRTLNRVTRGKRNLTQIKHNSKDSKTDSESSGQTIDKLTSESRKQAVFRENGRRLCTVKGLVSDQLANGRSVGHDREEVHTQSLKTLIQNEMQFSPFECQLSPKDTTSMPNGDLKFDPMSTMTDGQYLPMALRDAIKGLYGSSVIYTKPEVKKVDQNDQSKLQDPSPVKAPSKSESTLSNRAGHSSKNNSRHLQIAKSIWNKVRESKTALKQGKVSFGGEDLMSESNGGGGGQETNQGEVRTLFQGLPVPLSFSNLPVPQSWFGTFCNSTSLMNGRPMQFSTQPPPLMRASEPREQL